MPPLRRPNGGGCRHRARAWGRAPRRTGRCPGVESSGVRKQAVGTVQIKSGAQRSRVTMLANSVGSLMVTGRCWRWQDSVSHRVNSSRLYRRGTAADGELGWWLAIGQPGRVVVACLPQAVARGAALLDAAQSGGDDEGAFAERGVSGAVEHP